MQWLETTVPVNFHLPRLMAREPYIYSREIQSGVHHVYIDTWTQGKVSPSMTTIFTLFFDRISIKTIWNNLGVVPFFGVSPPKFVTCGWLKTCLAFNSFSLHRCSLWLCHFFLSTFIIVSSFIERRQLCHMMSVSQCLYLVLRTFTTHRSCDEKDIILTAHAARLSSFLDCLWRFEIINADTNNANNNVNHIIYETKNSHNTKQRVMSSDKKSKIRIFLLILPKCSPWR